MRYKEEIPEDAFNLAFCSFRLPEGKTCSGEFWAYQFPRSKDWAFWCPELGGEKIIEVNKNAVFTVSFLKQPES